MNWKILVHFKSIIPYLSKINLQISSLYSSKIVRTCNSIQSNFYRHYNKTSVTHKIGHSFSWLRLHCGTLSCSSGRNRGGRTSCCRFCSCGWSHSITHGWISQITIVANWWTASMILTCLSRSLKCVATTLFIKFLCFSFASGYTQISVWAIIFAAT